MNDEDAEYDFLYHTIPELEKSLVVYATTAVKERVLTEPMGAKVRVEVDERTDWLELKFDMEGFGKPKSGKSSNRLKKTQISPVAKRERFRWRAPSSRPWLP